MQYTVLSGFRRRRRHARHMYSRHRHQAFFVPAVEVSIDDKHGAIFFLYSGPTITPLFSVCLPFSSSNFLSFFFVAPSSVHNPDAQGCHTLLFQCPWETATAHKWQRWKPDKRRSRHHMTTTTMSEKASYLGWLHYSTLFFSFRQYNTK